MELIFETFYDHKAYQAAVNIIGPCLETSVVQPQTSKNKVYRTETGALIERSTLKIECVKKTPVAPENVTKVLTWGGPEKRENGDPLPIEEISHYILEYNGQSKIIAKDQTSYTINGLSSGLTTFTMWTVDTDGLKSKPVTVEG